MENRRVTALSAMFAVATIGAGAHAGPDWTESTEAGELPGNAETPSGMGPLRTISGELSGPGAFRGAPVGDFQDVFRIEICQPEVFTARTDGADAQGVSVSTFDTSLFLFQANGFGVLANLQTQNQMAPNQRGSLILPMATDVPGVGVPGPGTYLIAISGRPSEPVSGQAGPIFEFAQPTEVSSADGPGGADPFTGWSPPGEIGEYVIALRGAAFPAACAQYDLNFDNFIDSRDLAILLGSWGMPYGSQDLSGLLGFWGPCECPCKGAPQN